MKYNKYLVLHFSTIATPSANLSAHIVTMFHTAFNNMPSQKDINKKKKMFHSPKGH